MSLVDKNYVFIWLVETFFDAVKQNSIHNLQLFSKKQLWIPAIFNIFEFLWKKLSSLARSGWCSQEQSEFIRSSQVRSGQASQARDHLTPRNFDLILLSRILYEVNGQARSGMVRSDLIMPDQVGSKRPTKLKNFDTLETWRILALKIAKPSFILHKPEKFWRVKHLSLQNAQNLVFSEPYQLGILVSEISQIGEVLKPGRFKLLKYLRSLKFGTKNDQRTGKI